MIRETDDSGRLSIPVEIREQHGDRFHIVEYADRIVLIPIDDDPLAAVREAVGDAFDGISAAELKRQARELAREEIEAEIEDRERRRNASEDS